MIADHHGLPQPSRRAVVGTLTSIGFLAWSGNAIGVASEHANQIPIATRPIPHSGEALPVIGLGTATSFSVGRDEAKRAALKQVIEQLMAGGGTLVDTASSYGSAECVLGAIISDQDRGQLFTATKLANGGATLGAQELRRSLDRRRMAKVDLLQLHNVRDPKLSLAPFRDWKAQGLCRYVGITTTYKGDYGAAESTLRREKPDFMQVDYSLDNRS